jgi:molybdopterin synthase catalytic subunit
MKVRVRLFASYREAAGVGELGIDLAEGATIEDAIAAVAERYPRIGPGGRGRTLVAARNREYVALDARLAEGDEVALIPPVSGGAGSRIMVTPTALSVDAAIAAVRGDDSGGIVVFLGTVRDHSRGKRVQHLEYEAYPEMAEAKLREIAERLEQAHAPLRIALHHRIGDLAIGEIAVVVAAAAPHRDAAFVAARAAIDELKEVVPIWKKEHTDDGAVWVEAHA